MSDLDTGKKEVIKELKNIKYNYLEALVFRMELTYSEIENILDAKYIDASFTENTLQPGIYENTDSNLMLNSLLPDGVKVDFTIDDIGLGSNLTTNKTISFTKNSFFFTILGFTHSQSGPLRYNEVFVQLIPGTNKSEKLLTLPKMMKLLKNVIAYVDLFQLVYVNLYCTVLLEKPPGQERHRRTKIKLFKKIRKSVSSLIIFYLEDDDHKPVDFCWRDDIFYLPTS